MSSAEVSLQTPQGAATVLFQPCHLLLQVASNQNNNAIYLLPSSPQPQLSLPTMLLSTTTTRTLPQGRACAAASLPRPHQPRLTRTTAASSSSSDITAISPSNGNGVAAAAPPTPAQAPTASPPPAAPTAPFRPSAAAVSATKLELLSELSALDRGTLATPAQKDTINRLVASLEASGSGAEPFAGSPAPVEGRWQLIYNSKAVFTAR